MPIHGCPPTWEWKIPVHNIGATAADMRPMANPLAVIARRFFPDMPVVNLAVEDITAASVMND